MIPLNSEALAAIKELRERAKHFGGTEPDHYIFPACEGHRTADPTRPMRDWRTAWRKLTRKAGLAGLRFHDMRHHAITELAESGASEQTIMAIAGHVSRRMLETYSHIRVDAKRKALDVLAAKPSKQAQPEQPQARHVTNHVTMNDLERDVVLQLIEKNGGSVRTRTADLLRVKQAL